MHYQRTEPIAANNTRRGLVPRSLDHSFSTPEKTFLRCWRRAFATVLALIWDRRVYQRQSPRTVPWVELKVPMVLLRLITARPEATVFSTSEDIASLQIVPVRNVDGQSLVVEAVLAVACLLGSAAHDKVQIWPVRQTLQAVFKAIQRGRRGPSDGHCVRWLLVVLN